MTKILIAVAVLPALAVMLYIRHIDKVEREPWGLLFKIMLFGALSVIPILICEEIVGFFIDGLFPKGSILHGAAEAFLCAALCEESFKLLVLRRRTWKHPAFNYTFDGVVYGVFASMGFALIENILYVLQYGLSTGIVRALTSIPGHAIFGVFMGMYYGLAKREDLLGNVAQRKHNMFMAWLTPLLLHGFYDFWLMVDIDIWPLIGLVYYIAMVVIAFRKLSRIRKEDAPLPQPVPTVPPMPPYYGGTPQQPYVGNPQQPNFGGAPQQPPYQNPYDPTKRY